MAKVGVKKVINATAHTVWEYVSNWGGTSEWIPGVGPVTVEGDGVGAIRSADLAPETGFPGRISERLESYDNQVMTFSYSVIGDSPIPITDYLASMSVEKLSNNTCEVTWGSTWETELDESELIAAFEMLYSISLDNVAKATC